MTWWNPYLELDRCVKRVLAMKNVKNLRSKIMSNLEKSALSATAAKD